MRTEGLATIRRLKRTNAPVLRDPPLTGRSLQVACGVVLGLGNKDIGRLLGISPHNVRDRVTLLMQRFRTNTRTGVACAPSLRYCTHCSIIDHPNRTHDLAVPTDGHCVLRAELGGQLPKADVPGPAAAGPTPPTDGDPLTYVAPLHL